MRELVFLELLDALARGADHRSIAGLAYRDEQGNVVQNPLAPIPHPDSLPSFPYHRVDIQRYIRRTFLGTRTTATPFDYGCPSLQFLRGRQYGERVGLPQSGGTRGADRAEMMAEQWGVNAR